MKKLLFTLLLAAAGLSAWADDLYLVGGALSVGWNKENLRATVMIETGTNTHIYEWTGYINSGGTFKILRQTNIWDCGYNAPGEETTLSSTPSAVWARNNSSDPDKQWKVSTSGVYKITFDQEAMTIKAESATLTATVPTYTDGYYQIGSADDLVNFADAINKGVLSPNVKAKLIDNIDMDGRTDFAPICWAEGIKFTGEFDGQGKSITNLNLDYGTTFGYAALIGFATDGAEVKNVIVSGSVKGLKRVAGIVGMASGGGTITLTNVINMVNVDATGDDGQQNAAGLVGCGDGTVISAMNCANMGEIKNSGYTSGPGQCAAFAGWTSKVGETKTTFTNCWNKGDIYNMDSNKSLYRNDDAVTATDCYDANGADFYTQGTKIARASVASGKLCYKLGHGTTPATWTQTIGTDSHPIPFNTRQTVNEVVADESYSNLPVSSNKVQIANGAALAQFAKEVNAGNESMDALLTTEIDMSGVVGFAPIGTTTYKYAGTFDGGNNRIKNLTISSDEKAQLGLFSYCASATIQNLIMDSSCSVTSTYSPSDPDLGWGNAAFVGICAGDNSNLTFLNCGNEASVTGARGNNAAFVGKKEDSGSGTITFTNCYNTGNISGGGYNTAFIGDNASKSYTTNNCYNSGTISRNDGNTDKWVHSAGSSTVTNCYTTTSDNGVATGLTEGIDDSIIKSGELCFNLKGDNVTNPFTQDLSAANHPTFGSKEVHIANWFDSDIWDIYYNEEGSTRTAYILNLNETKPSFNLDPNYTLTAKNVKMTRTISAGKWNTFCSPVAIAKSNFTEVKKLSSVAQNGEHYTMTFTNETADYLEAGKPYMVQVGTTTNELTASNATVVTAPTSDSDNGLYFNGTFVNRTAPDGSFIISNNAFYLVDSTVELKGFRGFFTLGAPGVKALNYIFDDDDATAIEMVNGQSSMVNGQSSMVNGQPIYNLAGQRISKMQKGINIMNGKKIIK